MTLFQNGHVFSIAIPLLPPSGRQVPFIKVKMARPQGFFKAVVGKLDTGAAMTVLSFQTAIFLGIPDPTVGFLVKKDLQTATGRSVKCYVHRVSVCIPNPAGRDLTFVLAAGFTEKLPTNLFGMDWMSHICVAVDRQRVHALRA
jgi:predicted aspartyl protease